MIGLNTTNNNLLIFFLQSSLSGIRRKSISLVDPVSLGIAPFSQSRLDLGSLRFDLPHRSLSVPRFEMLHPWGHLDPGVHLLPFIGSRHQLPMAKSMIELVDLIHGVEIW